jgi:UDP-GlcNAc:undecaprenyl-phosphate GlcNAc-1-phosphate transferase
VSFFLIFTTALVITLLLVPPVKQLAFVVGVTDKPCERKIHKGHVPRLGGLAIFISFFTSVFIYFHQFQQFRGIFIGMFIIVIVGIIDDAYGLDAKMKFLGQIVAGLAAITLSGVNIQFLGSVLGSTFSLGWLSMPLTLFWIVGITNAINLSDGLDGLASGISLIAFLCFGLLAYQRGDIPIFTLCLIMVGCILGFLKYNTHPAEIFMGDTGSLFLGFSLGTISLMGNFKTLTFVTLITPALILLVPILDTLWAIVRRIRQGRSPFSADNKHFHHRLLAQGMNQTQSVSVIYYISTILSVVAVVLGDSRVFKFFLIPILLLSLCLLLLQIFHKIELRKPIIWISSVLDHWVSHNLRGFLADLGMYLVMTGVIFYLASFIFGLTQVEPNILVIASTIMILVLYLLITRGRNGTSFIVFSVSFLALVFIVVTETLISKQVHVFGIPYVYLEEIGFLFLAVGVFAKIIFKKRTEIILSTPLEFFTFLTLISLSFAPQAIMLKYELVRVTIRTIFLFLSFKIFVLSGEKQSKPTWIILLTSVVCVLCGIFV